MNAAFVFPSLSVGASLFVGGAGAQRAACGAARGRGGAVRRELATMQDKSPAMPFLSKPKNLSPDMPGYRGFDPLHLTEVFDANWMREAEYKNGRVAALACVHFFVIEFLQLPFFAGAPKLAAPAHDYFVKSGAMIQILVFIGLVEYISNKGKVAYVEMFEGNNKEPGDFGFNPVGLPADKSMKDRELNNLRLAMIGFGGIVHQQFLTGQLTFEQLRHFQPLSF